MIDPDKIAIIRRALRKEHSYREIAATCGVSVGLVQKIKHLNLLEFEYKRAPGKQPYPQLGAYREQLEGLLLEDSTLPKHKRRKWSRLHEALQRSGYQGGYDSVRRYANKWMPPPEEKPAEAAPVPSVACTPQVFRAGEAFQFDWSTEHVLINGIDEKIYVAQFTLCHSRMKFMRAYPRQQTEMVLDAHLKAFEFFGGVCEVGIYDNMKTAVKTILLGKDRDWNKDFSRMCSFFCFEPRACTPRRGNEKGTVERAVQTNREDLFKTRPQVSSLEELNGLMEAECWQRARTRKHPDEPTKTVYERFLTEKRFLMSFADGYLACREHEGRSSKTLLVHYDKNQYSVDYTAAYVPVTVRTFADRIVILRDGLVVGEHDRSFESGRILFHIEHYIPILRVKPGSIRNGLPYQIDTLPEGLVRVRRELEKKDDFEKQFVGILKEVITHGLANVVAACELAMDEGPVSADIVRSLLSRLSEPAVQAELPDLESRLQLNAEPSSDCSGYDQLLRRNKHVEPGRKSDATQGPENEWGSPGL